MSVAVRASRPESPADGGKIWRWNSATPYLLGSIVLVMLLISVALLMLLCSLHKERRRTAALASGHKSVKGEMMYGAAVPGPEFVVIMAGNDRPTYLAMPTVLPSASISEAEGYRSGDHSAGPCSELIG